jgi:quinol monooxygenase YgiN
MISIGRVVVIATFRIFPIRERRPQVLGILRAIQGPTKIQPHCASSQVYEEDGYEEAILYMEQWDSKLEFHRHARSDLYRQILEAVELSRQTPEIHFHEVSETRGMDLLEELRGRNANQSLSNRGTKAN